MATKENHEQNGTARAGEESPPFPLTERDKWLLSLSDEDFAPHIHTWDGLKKIIGEKAFIPQLYFFSWRSTPALQL
jgi:hypothetical protein